MLDGLASGLEVPLAFIRAVELLKKERGWEAATDDDRKILWAAEQGLRQIETVRLLASAGAASDGVLVPEPVAVRGVLEEVKGDFGQFWRLVDEQPEIIATREQLLVDVNRRALKCFLASLLAESLQFASAGRLFARKVQSKIRVGVRDFGPALPRDFSYEKNQTLPLRPKSRASFLIIDELVRVMNVRLEKTSHRDGVSFFVELPESRQVRLL